MGRLSIARVVSRRLHGIAGVVLAVAVFSTACASIGGLDGFSAGNGDDPTKSDAAARSSAMGSTHGEEEAAATAGDDGANPDASPGDDGIIETDSATGDDGNSGDLATDAGPCDCDSTVSSTGSSA